METYIARLFANNGEDQLDEDGTNCGYEALIIRAADAEAAYIKAETYWAVPLRELEGYEPGIGITPLGTQLAGVLL